MSQQLIARNPDLKRLRDEGFDIEIRAGHLVIRGVPYVDATGSVQRGMLVSELTLAGDRTASPGTHVALFAGQHPCDQFGNELSKIKHATATNDLGEGLVVQHSFSSKPVNGAAYKDYYEKMTAYVAIIASHAQAVDPTATANTFPPTVTTEQESVFQYLDTASSRAGINLLSSKLELSKVGIVGLGGTGSYVLDLVAKTPVKEVHLFDGDVLLTHNAFRSPGAASLDELRQIPMKVDYLKGIYSKMRRGIVAHSYYLTSENASDLCEMDFVFMCMDAGDSKRGLVVQLEQTGVCFIDVGMGVTHVDGSLCALVRATTSTPAHRESIHRRAPFLEAGGDDPYAKNIQIADLNALNAVMAVIKWKKFYGFYRDEIHEHNSTYSINDNALINDDCAV